MLREHWRIAAAVAAMLVLLSLGGVFIAQQLNPPAVSARQTATGASQAGAGGGQSTPAPAGSDASPSPGGATPNPTASSHPGQPAAGPAATPSPATGGGNPPPPPPPPPPPSVTYPAAVTGSGAFTTKFLASDLALPQTLTERFTQSSAGAATLHSFWAATSSGYPDLKACLQGASQPTCTPVGLPYDSTGHVHWQIGSGAYLLRVAPYSSAQLVAVSLWWTGPHSDSVGGIAIPKSCSTYTAGCGVRFEFTTTGSGTCSVSVSTALHLRVQQKGTTNPPIFDGTVPADFAVPGGATWTGQLFSTTTPAPASAVTMGISWPP